MLRSHRSLAALLAGLALAAALVLAPALAEARAGSGSSFGSRGGRTWSAPPSTNTAPYSAPMQRSMTPYQSRQGTYGNRYQPGGLGFGLLGGLLGVGLAGLLLGHGFMGFGMSGLFGLLVRVLIVVLIVRWLIRMFRGPAAAYAGGGMGFAPAGPMPFARGGGPGAAPVTITPEDYRAFEQALTAIQAAWGARDMNRLSQLLTPEMLSYFNEQLTEQTSRGLRNVVGDVHLLQGDLSEAWAEGGREYATVAMRFQMTDVTYDSAGNVVDGSPTEHVTATEIWTFVRTPGGQWILSAIQQTR
jgi:predicted lipid-binding transport protein (Tim44 family)